MNLKTIETNLFHKPNLIVAIVATAILALAKALGMAMDTTTLVSFGGLVAAFVYGNAKISSTVKQELHSGNFWLLVASAIAYGLTHVFGMHLAQGWVMGGAAVVIGLMLGNTHLTHQGLLKLAAQTTSAEPPAPASPSGTATSSGS
jgi:hypothetical protein